jgi:predicted ATP-dependent Lon-type protease
LDEEDEGTRLAFEGIAKVLFPTGKMTEEEGRELLEFVLEGRQQALLPRL